MLVSDFDYDLPSDRIAQTPLADRAGSRLLQVNRSAGNWRDRSFREFAELLRPDDLLVLNNTRVFPARLYGRRRGRGIEIASVHDSAAGDSPVNLPHSSPGNFSPPLSPSPPRHPARGRIEVLLTRQITVDPNEWECLVRPGRKIGVGEKLYFGDAVEENAGESSGLEAEVTERGGFGERHIRFSPVEDFFARVERIGHVPLPPYIRRHDVNGGDTKGDYASGGHAIADKISDRERYQTVYAQARGSVAAPTAGLHFTSEVLKQIRRRGIEIAEITLHVGLGTFQPVRVEKVEDHTLHGERYEISEKAAVAINRAKAEDRRIVAIGTTTVRTLEYAANRSEENRIEAGRGEANLFIFSGYRFRVVDALLTNFHLPQSSLLMLVCALGGKELVMDSYRHAVAAGYRFYSYGDCMFVE